MKEIIQNSINWEQKCWRYFKTDHFINSLENGYIYFAAANEFEDNFEGATSIYDSIEQNSSSHSIFEIINNSFKQLQRLTKINCWHKSDCENFLMWKLYAQNKKGVAITTTPYKMQQAFKPYKIMPQYCEEELYIGNVEYVDLITKHVDTTMLGMFFYKHLIFQSENEIRLSISLRTAEEFGVKIPEKGIFVQVDYLTLIDNIIIGPNIDNDEKNRIYNIAEKLNIKSKIIPSCLTYKPNFI